MIKLEALKSEDFHKIVEWNNDESEDFLLQWAGPIYTYPLTEEQIEMFFLEKSANKGTDMLIYKIVLEVTGEMVGIIEIRKYEKEENTGRVGRVLIGEDSVRGKGVGGKALSELVRIGFEELHYDKICLGVFDYNLSAIKCYENVGFKKDKLIEKYREVKDGYWNLQEMSILKEEWIKKN